MLGAMLREAHRTAFLAIVSACASCGSTILVDQNFKSATATGWALQGSSTLTAPSIDPSGSGWLRLTSSATNQGGLAFTNTAMAFNYGLDIKFNFDFWSDAKTGGYGLGLVLFDGSVEIPSAGSHGGSLGFAQQTGVAGFSGAILGIGFDETGNFANPTLGRQGGPGLTADAITLRGPGDGTSNALNAYNVANYGYIATSGNLTTNSGGNDVILRKKSGDRPTGGGDFRQAQVIIDTTQLAAGKLPVRIYLQQGNNAKDQEKWVDVDVYSQLVSYYGGVQNIPSTFKLAFTGATGANGSTDFHEVQGLTVTSLQTVPLADSGSLATPEASTSGLALSGILMICLSIRGRR